MSGFICLGIESSCDDSAAGVVKWHNGRAEILSSLVFDQQKLHADYGGVVPEIAARAHTERLDYVIEKALKMGNVGLKDISLIAVTSGPGLIGGVMAGVMMARGIAAGANIELIGINHLAGHALSPRMCENLNFPYLLLLVSGGHCQFLLVKDVGNYTRLGGTIDDSPGEAFDKVARILGLGQPGGPAIEKIAKKGDAKRFSLPRPMLKRNGLEMSFSGLKTAVLRARDDFVTTHGTFCKNAQNDLAASFQSAIIDVLANKALKALEIARDQTGKKDLMLAIAGGVAANKMLRKKLGMIGTHFVAPPLQYCTDNGAMIAWAGLEAYHKNLLCKEDLRPRPRWPLDQKSPALLGGGKKGAKA